MIGSGRKPGAATQRAFDSLLGAARLAIELGLYEGDARVVAHLMWAHVHGLVSLHLAGKLKAGLSLQQLLLGTQPLGVSAGSAAPIEPHAHVKRTPRT